MFSTNTQICQVDLISSTVGVHENIVGETSNHQKLILDRENIKSQCRALINISKLQGNKRSLSDSSFIQEGSSSSTFLPRKSLKNNDGESRNSENIFLLNQNIQHQENISSSQTEKLPLSISESSQSYSCSNGEGEEDDEVDYHDEDHDVSADQVDNESSSQNMQCLEDPISEESSNTLPKFDTELFIVEETEKSVKNDNEAHSSSSPTTATMSSGQLDFFFSSEERILILDLDNTLVHSYLGQLKGSCCEQIESDSTISLIITTHMENQKLMVKRRAFLKEFLQLAFSHFQVVMYTLGSITYARAVHEIFKASMPDVFSNHQFFRIIAQSSSRQNSTQNAEKDISKYFSLQKFSHRLLIIDDNPSVYSNEWQRNIIITKPFHFWNPSGIEATIQEYNQSEEDQFLFFAHKLLKDLVIADPLKERITCVYNEQLMSILADEVIQVINSSENQNAVIMALQMGATVASENPSESDTIPTTIIDTNSINNIALSGNNNSRINDTVTENWLKYCIFFAVKIPKLIWHQVKNLPNIEITLVQSLP